MRISVTGGCGYAGSVLVPKLLAVGHEVRVIDICWFGNYLKPHPSLIVEEVDIRSEVKLRDPEAIIHLAAIANDPTGELDAEATWEVNALATMRLAEQAARHGVRQFIYASSGSVYGVSDAPQVTEEVPLVPLSVYNKTKQVAERCVLSYADRMCVQILRPATVCGLSPRMRLDVVVNQLTLLAAQNGMIGYHGGDQVRPHIHIDDLTDLYMWILDRPHLTGVYNAGFENLSVRDLAQRIVSRVGAEMKEMPIIDKRSYRLNSDKLLRTGFVPKKSVDDAIDEVALAYYEGELKDEERWHNLLSMKRAA